VYHEADRAGPHLDLYLDDGHLAHNIGVKRLPAPLKTNRLGKLTAAAKQQAIRVLGRELENRAWLAQSTTHTPAQARAEWGPGKGPQGYGAGPVRELISDLEVEVVSDGQKASWTDWEAFPDSAAYVFKIMREGPTRSKNILALGTKRSKVPRFEERLHLKFDKTEDEFLRRLGPGALLTEKEDGAACHILIDHNGLRAWSPRTSVETGRRIEYTSKLGSLADTTSPVATRAMGELLFRRPGTWATLLFKAIGAPQQLLKGAGKIASFNEIGSLLNANRLPPRGWKPEIVIYRVDHIRRQKVLAEPYDEHMERCKALAKLHPRLRAPTIISAEDLPDLFRSGSEGAVGVAAGASIVNGRKFKFREEMQDGIIRGISFRPGQNGGVEGVVYYEDDKTGQMYKTASGFNRQLKLDMAARPSTYIGRTMLLAGFTGHAARAAVFRGFHQDK